MQPGCGCGLHSRDKIPSHPEQLIGRHLVEPRHEIVRRRRRTAGFRGFDLLFLGQGDVVRPFDVAHDVAVQHVPIFDPERGHPPRFDQASPVRHHFHTHNVQQRSVLHELRRAEISLRFPATVVQHHSEFAVAAFDRAPDHQPIPGFEDVQERRHRRVRQRAHKQGQRLPARRARFLQGGGFRPRGDRLRTQGEQEFRQ